jgi:hypothetical protein
MFGYQYAWKPIWALIEYNATKFDGPGKWLWLKQVYWEWHNGQRIYYADKSEQ